MIKIIKIIYIYVYFYYLHITVPLHHHTTALTYHCTTAPPYYYTNITAPTAPPYYCTNISLHHCTTILMHQYLLFHTFFLILNLKTSNRHHHFKFDNSTEHMYMCFASVLPLNFFSKLTNLSWMRRNTNVIS